MKHQKTTKTAQNYYKVVKMKLTKKDIINLTRAYLGALFMASWGIWSYGKYNIAFLDMEGFIIKLIRI